MSLGSLTQWQSALLSVAGFAHTVSCHGLEIPMSVVATALIGSMVYFHFEYTGGSVVAALALLETPAKDDISELEKAENEPGDASSSDSAANTKPLLWRLVSALGMRSLICAATYVFLVFVCKHDVKVQSFILPQLLLALHNTLSTKSSHPDAITAQRSRVRQHIQSQGTGFWSTYPGLAMFLVYMLLSSLINVPAELWFHDKRIEYPVRVIWGILLTNLHTAWVHIVISKPSTKLFWQRIPGWREWIEILPAASLDIILPSLVYHLLKIPLALVYDNRFFGAIGDKESTDDIQIVFMLPLALAYLSSLATRAMYIRVAASMLPSEDEPLVPFDRSFGGQARNSRTYSLSIKDARTGKAQSSGRYLNIVWGTLGPEVICLAVSVIVLSAELVYWSPCTVIGLAHLAFADA